jgi:hypothetical protein
MLSTSGPIGITRTLAWEPRWEEWMPWSERPLRAACSRDCVSGYHRRRLGRDRRSVDACASWIPSAQPALLEQWAETIWRMMSGEHGSPLVAPLVARLCMLEQDPHFAFGMPDRLPMERVREWTRTAAAMGAELAASWVLQTCTTSFEISGPSGSTSTRIDSTREARCMRSRG